MNSQLKIIVIRCIFNYYLPKRKKKHNTKNTLYHTTVQSESLEQCQAKETSGFINNVRNAVDQRLKKAKLPPPITKIEQLEQQCRGLGLMRELAEAVVVQQYQFFFNVMINYLTKHCTNRCILVRLSVQFSVNQVDDDVLEWDSKVVPHK